MSMRLFLTIFVFCGLVFPGSAYAQILTGYGFEAEQSQALEVEDQPVLAQSLETYSPPPIPADLSPILTEPAPVSSQPSGRLLTGYFEAEELVSGPSMPQEQASQNAERLLGSSDQGQEDAPVDLEADNVSYDEQNNVVRAVGNVIMVQDGRILRADEVEYNLTNDTAKAFGNVVLNEVNGDIHFSQEVEFNDKLKNGFVEGLRTYLTDGSRFTAARGKRVGGNQTIMSDASYTACEACKKDPDRPVPWRIRASEVKHDEEDARISYRNARFEAFGVPVAYTPYFAHADGTVKRKSGFLAPSLGFKSELGAFVENQYYWNIAPDKDLTFGLNAYTEEIPLGTLEYRQRWDQASFIINGGGTYSERIDQSADVERTIEEEFRGHVFADGRWDMNDKWRSGLEVAYVSDDQYARQYDVTNDDVLENRLFVERFSGRNYARGVLEAFQDIRISDLEVDQPHVLPQLNASFIGEPGQVPLLKGRWDAHVGFLSLFRDEDGQDVNRGSVDLGWERRFVSDYGLVANADATLRGDLYHVNDRNVAQAGSGRSGDSTESRFFPQIHVESSYPVAKNFENSQLMIEPMAAFTVAPEINENDDIPNEDSQDVQLDSSNLFSPNRFPGLDVVEDETRATYGMRTGVYGHGGSSVETFIGQSYRFDDDNSNPFLAGSGLNDEDSDVVGYVNGNYNDRYTLSYRFQLDNQDLTSERHELDVYADWNVFRLGANYLFAEPLEGTEITESREQVRANAQYYFDKEWRLTSSATQDLGQDPGLRQAALGLDYFGQCVSWSLIGVRNLTDDASGDSSTEFLFRIGLRNISEFVTSGLRDTPASE